MRKACLVVFVLTILTGTAGASETCPSPAPTCATTGTLTINGSYSCTAAGLDGSGYPKLSLLIVSFTSTGAGTGTIAALEAQNTNDPNTIPSYVDFTSGTGNYCINADNRTGYITLASGGGCPIAIAFAGANGVANAQFRGINSAENRIRSTVCRQQ